MDDHTPTPKIQQLVPDVPVTDEQVSLAAQRLGRVLYRIARESVERERAAQSPAYDAAPCLSVRRARREDRDA